MHRHVHFDRALVDLDRALAERTAIEEACERRLAEVVEAAEAAPLAAPEAA